MRQEAYRVAFEEANWELKDIVGQFDVLSTRKVQVEKVVEVLKPFVSFSAPAAGTEQWGGGASADSFHQRFENGVNQEGKGYTSSHSRGLRQDAYRVAYEEANVEMREFGHKYEQLCFRKEQIERLVDVLRPLVSQGSTLAVVETGTVQTEPSSSGEVVQEPAGQSEVVVAETAQQPEDAALDPFQRRGEVPVPVAAGSTSKDLRDYSRLFSSSLHRR
jgi:hypothetical protein